jgi:predicted ATPase
VLTAIQLANFKAFADVQRIPIRPLTLIFGPNSSGKSSIIHSLVLARHAIETGHLDAHRTHIGGEAVDLGGFNQYIYRRDPSRRMQWAIELNAANLHGRLAELLAPVGTVAVSLSFGISLDNEGRPLPGASPEVDSYEVIGDGKTLLRMSRRRDSRLQLDRIDHEHPVFREVLRAIVETSTTATAIQPSDYEGLDDAISSIVPEIMATAEKLLPRGLARSEAFASEGNLSLFPISKGQRREDLAAAVRFFVPRKIDELIRGLAEAVEQELLRFQYLGPLRSYPPRHLAFSQHHDPNWFAGGGYAWDEVRRDKKIRQAVNAWLGSEEKLQTPYELVVRELVGIDDIEPSVVNELSRLIEDSMVWDEKEESEQFNFTSRPVMWQFDPEVEAKDLRKAIRKSGVEKLRELVLTDRRTNTVVSHRDVGIGVSQVLPVLVAAYGASNKVLAMEQPEIHLHPALQAELADVFIASALGEQKNVFILETHSEHLILRVLRRIRETAENEVPQGTIPVRPENVAVLYVTPTKEGSVVTEIPVLADGEFGTRWPQGFFPERAKELF